MFLANDAFNQVGLNGKELHSFRITKVKIKKKNVFVAATNFSNPEANCDIRDSLLFSKNVILVFINMWELKLKFVLSQKISLWVAGF